jgi:LCP family protein required for cell wall assembly
VIIAASVASLALTVGGAAGYVYTHLSNNIHTAGDLNSLTHRPAVGPSSSTPGGGPPINILLLGSQTRDGQAGQFGGSDSTGSFGGSNGTDISDTSMLLHIYGDRKHALVVSIPRDTLVTRPACLSRDGKSTIDGGTRQMFDASMSLGGPLCAAATVEQMWDIRVDHFVRLDFNGFRKIVTYLGGVQVCVPPPGINDPYSHLNLPAGLHVVTGDEALAFVRDRHGIGNGSDLGRIQMQQMFLSSLISKLESDGTLADPAKLYSLANITTSSITTDTALGSIGALLDLASSVQGLKPHDIHFVTMPTVYDTIDPNRVDPAPGADALWTLVRDDQWLDGALPASGSQTPTASAPPASAPTVSPPTQTAATPDPGSSTAPSPSPSPTPDTSAPTSLQDRPADQDICANLPTPNTNAASGG